MTQTNLEQFAMASGALQSSVDNSKAAKNAMAREKAQDRLNKAIKNMVKIQLKLEMRS